LQEYINAFAEQLLACGGGEDAASPANQRLVRPTVLQLQNQHTKR